MSKRSLFWGQASGKLGETVYYRAGGEQRTRSYVAKIKNPKTRAQALQRTKFNNAVAVFRGTSAFVKSLFKAEKSSQSPFNAFVKRNFPLCLTVADREMVELGEGGSQNFVFSNGSVNFNTMPSIIPFKPLGSDESTLGYYWGWLLLVVMLAALVLLLVISWVCILVRKYIRLLWALLTLTICLHNSPCHSSNVFRVT